MATELYYLALMALLTAVMWAPYGLDLLIGQGIGRGLGNRDDVEPLSPWAERARRAHANTVENLVVFAAVVLAAHAAGVTNATTATAAMLYFWMRLAYYIVYTLGVPGLRTVIWTVAWVCQVVIAWQVIA